MCVCIMQCHNVHSIGVLDEPEELMNEAEEEEEWDSLLLLLIMPDLECFLPAVLNLVGTFG